MSSRSRFAGGVSRFCIGNIHNDEVMACGKKNSSVGEWVFEDNKEALDNKDTYYISGDILIIEKDKYTRVK